MDAHALFWAKTQAGLPGRDPTAARYKPVAHHLLDVAAVTDRYLAAHPGRLRRESMMTGLCPEAHSRLCRALAALHDLGKISPWFQAQAPEFWPTEILGEMPETAGAINHWQATAVLLGDAVIRGILETRLPAFAASLPIVAAVAGHHGAPPGENFLGEKAFLERAAIGEICIGTARSLCRDLLDLLVPEPIAAPLAEPTEAFSFSLNGLITLSDWVGSDCDLFAFEDPRMPLAAYWPLALSRAESALRAKGLTPARSRPAPVLSDLSPRAGEAPRPMQVAAGKVAIGSEPQLFLIEDATGSGKTEAALLLAARMMAAGQGEGIYVALPTMATANVMHGRLDAAIGGLFEETAARPLSLVLAHGKAGLASALENLAHGEAADPSVRGPRDETVSERFNAWIGDSRKKAFFADAGAGTIDQAFLAILPKKHLTLRQYALAARILIVDEAHACDAYMGEELKTLVGMQARLGGSVIVLSATLGEPMRRDLILSFAQGRGLKDRHAAPLRNRPLSQAYPLLTCYAGEAGLTERPVETQGVPSRCVKIARLDDRAASVALALEAAGRGAAVAIVCNAVDSAIAVHAALAMAGHPAERLTLFHARFVVGDRMAIEQRVLRLFGPQSEPEMRAGQILVATQVVEQSLDLDFDAMISDLAPVDLLIQRAGRLWRHHRDGRPVETPVLHIVSPDFRAAGDAGWLRETLGPAASTYRLPGVLWRTARDLFTRACLQTPGDLRQLVEAAYRADSEDLPKGLVDENENATNLEYGERYLGQINTIKPQSGYAGLRAVSPDEAMGTRLGEETVTLRLGTCEASRLVPLVRRPGAGEAVNWALSEISVRSRWLAGKQASGQLPLPAAHHAAAVMAVRKTWPEWEQAMPLYGVDKDGRLLTLGQDRLVYDAQAGLQRLEPGSDRS